MKKLFTFFAVASFAAVSAQTTLTEWNFDSSNLTPSFGSGTVSLVNTKESLQTGANSCNCAFVAGNPSSGKAYTITGFPAQGTGSGTAGIQFKVSSAQYENIAISADILGSNTAANRVQFQYSTDGTTWTSLGNPTLLTAGTWSTMSNSLNSNADNNAELAFRIVTIFDPSNPVGYTAIGASSNYGPGGTLRFDNVRVNVGRKLAVSDVNAAKNKLVKNTSVGNVIEFGTKANIQIINLAGQIVKTAQVQDGSSIDVSNLAKGLYIVAGEANGQKVSVKVVKY